VSSYLRVLRYPDSHLLFLGQSASAVGDQAVVVSLGLFITQLTGSPTDLGLVLAAQTLPLVVLILFGGVWADRLPRHRIMIVTDWLRAALHGTLAIRIFAGAVLIWELLLILARPMQDVVFALGAPVGVVIALAFGTGCGSSLLMI
jgi:MFS family permease